MLVVVSIELDVLSETGLLSVGAAVDSEEVDTGALEKLVFA
jgi:hypothetical protein